MALPKIQEARELDDQALEAAIIDTRKRLFDLRFQQATRQLESGLHQFKHERHRLAQLMTVLRERELSAQPQEEASDDTSADIAASAASITDTVDTTDVAEEE
ncbi:50S ribosomal protein L29 [Oscillatoria sp. CS-180]|uniref:50S ribosomal protein L29 n=1 Tax=Oscillatoria sp. CS-180 TaxID=3021720 RepID=UPI00232CBCF2|nr:50S ribosomal protein L29 [Oscillatoria sp. CS-180]MDB9525881.1 50S ribosomal protein L29 [Oscillatoria sp. CS-180]